MPEICEIRISDWHELSVVKIEHVGHGLELKSSVVGDIFVVEPVEHPSHQHFYHAMNRLYATRGGFRPVMLH